MLPSRRRSCRRYLRVPTGGSLGRRPAGRGSCGALARRLGLPQGVAATPQLLSEGVQVVEGHQVPHVVAGGHGLAKWVNAGAPWSPQWARQSWLGAAGPCRWPIWAPHPVCHDRGSGLPSLQATPRPLGGRRPGRALPSQVSVLSGAPHGRGTGSPCNQTARRHVIYGQWATQAARSAPQLSYG